MAAHQHLYSLIIAVHPEHENPENRNYPENPDVVDGDGHVHVLDNDNDHAADRSVDWRLGEITVDWVDFTREKSVDRPALSLASASMEGTSTLHGHGSGAGSGAGAGAASKPGSGSRRKVVGSTPTPSRPVPGSFTTATSTSASASAGSEHKTSHTSHPSHPSHPHSQSHSHSHATPTTRKKSKSPSDATSSPDSLSLQPLLAHFPGPNPLESSVASGVTQVGRGVVHLFRHAPPPALISSLEAHPLGESSAARRTSEPDPWSGERAEGEDGSLIAILAVPAWMRPADFLEFIGGWSTGLEGVRMIREATTPNRSIVLLKFRDPLQASDFLVIFTGRAFSTLDARETCHPIRIHHLVLHKTDTGADTGTGAPSHVVPSSLSRTRSASTSVNSGTGGTSGTVSIPAFPPSVYASRAAALPELLHGVPPNSRYELPSCPVCLERLDSTVTGLVTLPCAHTFDCDCLRKWGDSRCPVCRVSHLLLSTTAGQVPNAQSKGQVQAQAQAQGATGASALGQAGPREGVDGREEILRLTQCSMCDSTESNWICVVCGVVGCGRYEPGKGHARRHWEESGHVLAMELETQRVWDYKGDNYVHRLIQTRNDGKLVELPSASSLVTPISRPLPLSSRLPPNTPSPSSGRPCESESMPSSNARSASRHHSPSPLADAGRHRSSNGDVHGYAGGDRGGGADTPTEAGPSSNDIDKMSTIEAITLEYSYLLSSQLEAMRQHYESQTASSLSKLQSLESAESRAAAAESAREEAERARQKAEKKADKATELTRALQANLSAEKAMAQGLTARITKLREELEKRERETKDKDQEVKQLEETVRDLMFSLEAGATIKAAGGEDAGQGGDLVVVPGDDKKKKKGRK